MSSSPIHEKMETEEPTLGPVDASPIDSLEAAPVAIAVPADDARPDAICVEVKPAGEYALATSGEPSPCTEDASGDDDEAVTTGAWKKHVWTKAEDDRLHELIAACGTKVRWSLVGEKMDGRSGKQCRERWHNHLSPDVRKAKWSADEDRAIVEAVQLYGTRWSEIVKMFPGRTDNAIKNRWNSMQRKEERRQKRLNESAHFTIAVSAVDPVDPAAPSTATNDSAPLLVAAAEAAADAVSDAQAAAAAAAAAVSAMERPAQRRKLLQVADYRPDPALLPSATALDGAAAATQAPAAAASTTTPNPLSGAVVSGSALAQQLVAAGGTKPDIKPGGRRKRAVQARDDYNAASLVLGLANASSPLAPPHAHTTAAASGPSASAASANAAASTALGQHVAAVTPTLAARPVEAMCLEGHDDDRAAVAAAVAAAKATVTATLRSVRMTPFAVPWATAETPPTSAAPALAAAAAAHMAAPAAATMTTTTAAAAAVPASAAVLPAPSSSLPCSSSAAPAAKALVHSSSSPSLTKATALSALQLAPAGDKENSCAESPARRSTASASKVLTPSGLTSASATAGNSPAARRLAAACSSGRDWNAEGLEAAIMLAGMGA